MSIVNNEPLIRALLKKERTNRRERKLYLTPTANLNEVERLLVDIALNNTVVEDTVLPEEYEKCLTLLTSDFFQVADSVEQSNFNLLIMVIVDSHKSRLNIYIHDKVSDRLVQKQFPILVSDLENQFITSNLSKTVYLENAARLTKDKVYQYSESLADVYRLLFHVVYQTDLNGFKDTGNIERQLVELLKDTEVTLHLNITRTIKLYGTVDAEKFLTLNIREIGTPDTYWSRSALLPELINHV